MKVSREIDVMQFHLENALYIDGYIIKSGMNIIRRVEKDGKDYAIYHSDDFNQPYSHFPLNHVPALVGFISKKLIDSGMVIMDDNTFNAEEIKSGALKLVENSMHTDNQTGEQTKMKRKFG